MSSRILMAAAAFAVTTFVVPEARGDIPPPPGYVEQCTVEKQRRHGEECVFFRAGFNSPRNWSAPLVAHGLSLRCSTAGGSFWRELWCRAAVAGAKPLPASWYGGKDALPVAADVVRKTEEEALERCGPGDQGRGLGVKADAKPARAVAREKELQVRGAIDERLVARVLEDHAAEIRGCYAHRLPNGRGPQGVVPAEWKTVAIEWKIDDQGRAAGVHVDCSATTLDDPHVYKAMKARIASWTFPRARAGETVVVNHRWVLLPPLGEKR